jgi:hypothetical protein
MHTTNIKNTLTKFSAIQPNKYVTTEKHNKLKDRDLTIMNKQSQLTFGIYRKPTTTDLIIHNKSCHPYEHKKPAINYLINRMNTYPITHEERDQELKTMREI